MSSNATLDTPTPPAPASGPGAPAARTHRPAWALPAVVFAVLAVAAALVVGLRGLTGNPVVATAPDGTATISGTWEPFECSGCVQGYVQDGARSVFVRLPSGCAAPAREAHVTVHGRPAPELGKQSYTALACPSR